MTQNREHPGKLPLLPMGWGATNLNFEDAGDFWQEAKRVTAGSSLGESLDEAMAGESSPRIWLLLHEPGQGALTTAAALTLACELGSRDQAVLVLDCDDTDSQLTRWAGRHESEGLIDLVRYGASVLTSGVALPFSGRRGYILGVGSFTPTDIEPQEAEDLILRLKRQADDLILVAPANASGQIWAKLADIRLLCWDRARKSPDLIERVCTSFSDAGSSLTGLIGFGLPEEGVSLSEVEEAVSQLRESPTEVDDDYSEDDTDDRFEAADLEDVDYTESEELGDDPVDDEEAEGEDEGVGEAPLDDEDLAQDLVQPAAIADSSPPAGSGSGSSRVFWGAAVVSLALIIVVSVYYLKIVRPENTATPEIPPVVAVQQDLPVETSVAAGEDQNKLAEAVPEQQEPASDDVGSLAQETPAIDEPQATVTPTETESAQSASVQPAPVQSADLVNNEKVAEDTTREEEGPVFTMDPYLQTVGADGWALHLYSFPDSMLAVGESRRLERKGFQTAIHGVQLPEKGRWYRVYVGSFLTRSEALEARDPLLKKLEIDWARATEF